MGGSVGLRGGNAFASRVTRAVSTGPRLKNPGPGAYDVAPGVRTEAAASGGGPPLPSAVFTLPGCGNPAKFYERAAPGPGDYEVKAGVSARGGATVTKGLPLPTAGECLEHHRSVWVTTMAEAPGPGEYEVERGLSSPPPGWARRSHSCDARGETAQRRLRRHVDPAHYAEAAQMKLGQEILKGHKEPVRAPGPGEYDPLTKDSRICGAKGSSSFQLGLSHLPRTYRSGSPGPCQYDTQRVKDAEKVVNFAANANARFQPDQPGAPGPAYYSPKKSEGTQSFHLNLKTSWV